eukprot:TRINITY_DN4325_c0_g1_i1.p1 TRINITY_DN4325_c0_g1~~TRINITY_DN4325_c0_g1_i1.p1  ORF type:complete len:1506 (+),score=436.73 TRINITY_DN4325_c0_g1_i1:622-4518(+)
MAGGLGTPAVPTPAMDTPGKRASFRRRHLQIPHGQSVYDPPDRLDQSTVRSPVPGLVGTPSRFTFANPSATMTSEGIGSPASPAMKMAVGLARARKKFIGEQKKEANEPDSIVVHALIVMYLRRKEFDRAMREALEEVHEVTRERFIEVWQSAVGLSVRDALQGFNVFNFNTDFDFNMDSCGVSKIKNRAEEAALATAVFKLIDIDLSGEITHDEFVSFLDELTAGHAADTKDQTSDVREIADRKRRKVKLLPMAHGTIRQMQRHALSLALPRIVRDKFVKSLERATNKSAGVDRTDTEFKEVFQDMYCVVRDKRRAWNRMKLMGEKVELTVKYREMVEDREACLSKMMDAEELQKAFKNACGMPLREERIENAFAVFGDRIPVSELIIYCTRDPYLLSNSFNLEFAKQMRRRAYDLVALAFYIFTLGTTVIFFIEHEGSGRLPGDVFQTNAIDEMLAFEEMPGLNYRKTYFDIENVEAYWEWMYGPVMMLLWPDEQGTASHALGLGNHVIGGVKLVQARAERVPCEGLDFLIDTSFQANRECYPQNISVTEARWGKYCYQDTMIGGMFLGGGDGPNPTDSYHRDNKWWWDASCDVPPSGWPRTCTKLNGTGSLPATQIKQSSEYWKDRRPYINSMNIYNGTESEQERLIRLMEPWAYHECGDFGSTGAGLFTGRFGVSGNCGGYGAVLPVAWPQTEVKKMFDTLMANDWVDVETRGVRLEFFTYNQHTALFQRFQYLVDFTAGGMPVPARDVHSFSLFDPQFLTGGYLLFAVVALCNLYFLSLIRVKVYWRKYRHRMRHSAMGGPWAVWVAVVQVIKSSRMFVMDLVTIALTMVVILLKIIWMAFGLTSSGLHCQDRFPGGLEKVADVQRLINLMSAFTIAWLFLGVFQRLRTFKNARMLFDTLALASTDIVVICTITLIIFMSLGVGAWLVYSQTNIDYASLSHTLLNLVKSMLGEFGLQELERNRRGFTPVYFILFQAVSVMILLNMIIAVLTNALAQVQSTKYDSSAFIRRINNDPGTRFPAPQVDDGMLNWVVKLPAACIDELILAVHLTSYKALPCCCGAAARARYRKACTRSPRKVWEEYVAVFEMLERGSPNQVIAATLIIGHLVHRCEARKLTEGLHANESRVLRGVFGAVTALSADELLQEELSAGRKQEVEALCVRVPSCLLGRSQVRLWLDVLHVHDRWRRDADQWCKTDQKSAQETGMSLLEAVDRRTRALMHMPEELNRRMQRLEMAVTQMREQMVADGADMEARLLRKFTDLPGYMGSESNTEAGTPTGGPLRDPGAVVPLLP